MKKKNLVLITVASVACLLVLSACGAKQIDVPNHPPVIPNSVTTFDTEFGTLEPQGITFFLWPQFASEIAGASLIAKVKSAANRMDTLAVGMTKLTAEEKQMKDDFFGPMKCLEVADLEGEDPDMIEWVNNWKVPEDEPAKMLVTTCVSQQEARRTIGQRVDATRTEQGLAAGEFYASIEPGYPETMIGNSKPIVDQRGSSIEIKQTENGIVARIRLYGFEFDDNNQSSELTESTIEGARIFDISYDPRKKHLGFSVPEVSQNAETKELSLTGNHYRFELYRGQNFLGFARFAGDLNLLDANDTMLRSGSASVYGNLK